MVMNSEKGLGSTLDHLPPGQQRPSTLTPTRSDLHSMEYEGAHPTSALASVVVKGSHETFQRLLLESRRLAVI
jgi:hypothetical protein